MRQVESGRRQPVESPARSIASSVAARLGRLTPCRSGAGGGVRSAAGGPSQGRRDLPAASLAISRGGPDIALDVWVTQEQEGLKVERLLRNLLLLCNPDAQSSVWATPPSFQCLPFLAGR